MGEGGRPPGGRGSGTARRPRGCRSPVCSFLCFSREKRLSGPHRVSPWPCVSCDQPEHRGSRPALVRRGWRGLLDPLEGGPRLARGGSPRARRRRRGPGAGREWGGGGPCQEPPNPEPPRVAAALRVSDGTFLPVGQGSPPSRSKLEQSTLGCHCRGQGQSGSGRTDRPREAVLGRRRGRGVDGADGGGRSLRHAVPGPGRGDLEGPAPTFWLVPRAHTASWPCGPSRVFASQLVSGAGPPRPGDGGRPWLWGPVMAGWRFFPRAALRRAVSSQRLREGKVSADRQVCLLWAGDGSRATQVSQNAPCSQQDRGGAGP